MTDCDHDWRFLNFDGQTANLICLGCRQMMRSYTYTVARPWQLPKFVGPEGEIEHDR